LAIIKAYLLPHPPLAVPDVGRGEEKKIEKTLTALREISKEIAELAPETIIIVTPHAPMYKDCFHMSLGEKGRNGEQCSGNFAQFGAPEAIIDAFYDTDLVNEIASFTKNLNNCVTESDSVLDHGTTVPLWYINQSYKDYKLVRISQSGMSQDAHFCFGQTLAKAVEHAKRRVVLIASGDLSHKLSEYGPYGYAPEGVAFDKLITQSIDQGDISPLFDITEQTREAAAECGYNSLMILAGCMENERMSSRLLSYECPFGVGYAVASFQCPDSYQELARHSLEYAVMNNGKVMPLPENLPQEMLNRQAGVFVSLHKNGQLRGCIGTIAPTTEHVAQEIIQNAVSSGLSDLRFDAVTEGELAEIRYKVDVLAEPEPISDASLLDVKRYGVIVSAGMRRGLLLPNLDGIDSVEQQIAIACQKAGIGANVAIDLERFEVVRHG